MHKGTETVLLVDDDETLLRITARILRANGYTVLTAAGAPEALRLLEERAAAVDLLLTDVAMPEMNGHELALEVARRKRAGRTLYMSGYTGDIIVEHGVTQPGLAMICKPFSNEKLLTKVRSVLDAPADQAVA